MFKFFKKAVVVCAVAILGVSNAMAAEGSVTLPEIGVDVGQFITVGIVALGGVVAVAIGGYTAFLLVKKALKWIGRALN